MGKAMCAPKPVATKSSVKDVPTKSENPKYLPMNRFKKRKSSQEMIMIIFLVWGKRDTMMLTIDRS
jgi:hypothetical protein